MAQMTTTKKSSVWGDRIPSCTTNWKRRKRRFCNFKMSLKILNISQDKLNFLIALIILNICALIHLRDKIITIFICVSDIPSLQDALLDLKKQVSKLDRVNSTSGSSSSSSASRSPSLQLSCPSPQPGPSSQTESDVELVSILQYVRVLTLIFTNNDCNLLICTMI